MPHKRLRYWLDWNRTTTKDYREDLPTCECNANTEKMADCVGRRATKVSSSLSGSTRWLDNFCLNWKASCDFLFVINGNLGLISHRFWDMATYWLKIAKFPYPPLFYLKFEDFPFALDGWSYVSGELRYRANHQCNNIPSSPTYMITIHQRYARRTDRRHTLT